MVCWYHEVLHKELEPVEALRPKKRRRLPTVLTKDASLRYLATHFLQAGYDIRAAQKLFCHKDVKMTG